MADRTDFLVTAAGIAGLGCALRAAESRTVPAPTKKAPNDFTTGRAQGAIAAVTSASDWLESRVSDTGVTLYRPEAGRLIVPPGVASWSLDTVGRAATIGSGVVPEHRRNAASSIPRG